MLIGKVVGHVWATKKEESLTGMKLMVVQETETTMMEGNLFVAADMVGAGIGEMVLVVTGSTARLAAGSQPRAVDCTIVGIIDALDIKRNQKGGRL